MKSVRGLVIAFASILFSVSTANAALTGYLKLPDIDGESKRSVGANETLSAGANQTETIKGGQAVVIGALWNGSDTPPRRNSGGNVKLTLQRGALSSSLRRLKNEKRVIPSLKLVVDGKVGPQTAYELHRALITSYSLNGSGASAHEQVEIVFHTITWDAPE
ncbi:hypothetical protein [Hyphococcus sp.]|uniref:hypothetical protein n=1 Tax=Hyphococcus sp. TaxID=2038636 RepID=UPI00207F5370|nr:MAG: hypothetical protein DHS20C04_19040 [Marinicaulis sp.]